MNNELLFGADIAVDRKFEADSIKYGWDSAYLMEILRQVPTCFVPAIAKIFMLWSGAMHRVGKRVQALVNTRLEYQQADDGKEAERQHQDGVDWVISSSKTKEQASPLRMAQQMMALLFASTHQMQMAVTWAIVDLCLHPEYALLLRAEIVAAKKIEDGDIYNRLPLMECFLRESSRLNPLDSRTFILAPHHTDPSLRIPTVNMQRKAMIPFEFSNGSIVPPGNLVAIPQREIMRDSTRYSSPEAFNPCRFMAASPTTDAVTRYTDLNWDYTFWGSPHLPCPGRWYASHAMKHVLVHLLTNYDIDLAGPKGKSKWFTWTTAIVPRSNIHIIASRRAGT